MSYRIKTLDTNFYITAPNTDSPITDELTGVLSFHTAIPIINVYEDDVLVKSFLIETLLTNPDLSGQFLHFSVRILVNSGVMIDGIISPRPDTHPTWEDPDYEAIRLQPFFLSTADPAFSQRLIGKGLFERGLHYSGTITPTAVRNICICDHCQKSFTLQHRHGGHSELQYFYSEDSRQTLLVHYYRYTQSPGSFANRNRRKNNFRSRSPIAFTYYWKRKISLLQRLALPTLPKPFHRLSNP
jgi:hypothetical protein